MWECPDFFPLGDRHVLIYSTQGKSLWKTGKFDRDRLTFHPEESGAIDTGCIYAAKSQVDRSGNRLVWGWVQETRPVEEYRAAGWAGVMSLPRRLSLGNDGRLRMDVAPEVDQLRGEEQRLATAGGEEERAQQITRMKIEAACGEISCSLRLGAEAFALSLDDAGATSGSSGAWLSIGFDPADSGKIRVDDHFIPLVPDSAAVELKIYVDSSVIELIVNQSAAHTKRFYSAGVQPRNLRLRWSGSTRTIERLSVWPISPISANRLTT